MFSSSAEHTPRIPSGEGTELIKERKSVAFKTQGCVQGPDGALAFAYVFKSKNTLLSPLRRGDFFTHQPYKI
ncbi:hypothetical protein DDZ15_02195 [Rhodohalobacter mucosus]|uniref:Uncharacterized protein n=1 Tax=Rhodohalobacter mucosus TaxID=2079485 RepID=A0A316TTC3_9BACT|nr:hypothetical protein DDZ15_02195 [Rhodohalobacter mucosus]